MWITTRHSRVGTGRCRCIRWLAGSVLGVGFLRAAAFYFFLNPTQEAVAIQRELAAAYPDRYRPDLATSLSNLGVTFSELGRPGEALPPTQEAVAIYRELAAASPDRYRPDLARSLRILASALDGLNHVREAVAARREADLES